MKNMMKIFIVRVKDAETPKEQYYEDLVERALQSISRYSITDIIRSLLRLSVKPYYLGIATKLESSLSRADKNDIRHYLNSDNDTDYAFLENFAKIDKNALVDDYLFNRASANKDKIVQNIINICNERNVFKPSTAKGNKLKYLSFPSYAENELKYFPKFKEIAHEILADVNKHFSEKIEKSQNTNFAKAYNILQQFIALLNRLQSKKDQSLLDMLSHLKELFNEMQKINVDDSFSQEQKDKYLDSMQTNAKRFRLSLLNDKIEYLQIHPPKKIDIVKAINNAIDDANYLGCRVTIEFDRCTIELGFDHKFKKPEQAYANICKNILEKYYDDLSVVYDTKIYKQGDKDDYEIRIITKGKVKTKIITI